MTRNLSRPSSSESAFSPFDTSKDKRSKVVDRNLLTRKQHDDLLATPRPLFGPPRAPSRGKRRQCSIPKICPPRIDQLAIPRIKIMEANLENHNETLEPVRVVRLVKLIHAKQTERPRYTIRKKKKHLTKEKRKKKKKETCLKVWLKNRSRISAKLVMDALKARKSFTPNYRQLLVAIGLMKSMKIRKKKHLPRYTKQYLMKICEQLAILCDTEWTPYRKPPREEPILLEPVESVVSRRHVFWRMKEIPEVVEEEAEGEEEIEEIEPEEGIPIEVKEEEIIPIEEGIKEEGIKEEQELDEEGRPIGLPSMKEEAEEELEAEMYEEYERYQGEEAEEFLDTTEQKIAGADYGEGLATDQDGEDELATDEEGVVEGGQTGDEEQIEGEGEDEEEEPPGVEEDEVEGGQKAEGGEIVEGGVTDEADLETAEEDEFGEEGAGPVTTDDGEAFEEGAAADELIGGEAGGAEAVDAIEAEIAKGMEGEEGEDGTFDEVEGEEAEGWEGEVEGLESEGVEGEIVKEEVAPESVGEGLEEVERGPAVPGTEITDVHPPDTVSYLSWKIYSSWLDELGNNIQTYGKCLHNFREILEAGANVKADKIRTILLNWGQYLKESMDFENKMSAYFKGKKITKCPKCGDYTLYNVPEDHEIPDELKQAVLSTGRWRTILEEAEKLCKSFAPAVAEDTVSMISHESIDIVEGGLETSDTSMYMFEDYFPNRR